MKSYSDENPPPRSKGFPRTAREVSRGGALYWARVQLGARRARIAAAFRRVEDPEYRARLDERAFRNRQKSEAA